MSAKKKSWFRRALEILVLMVMVLGVAVYVMRDRIISRVLQMAEVQLEENGLYISHGSHELSWNRGVVLKGLVLYLDEEKQTRLAVFENVGIRVPILELFSDDAMLIFSSDHGSLKIETSAGDLQLDDLDFTLVANRKSLAFDRFEASANGLGIMVEGGLPWETDETEQKRKVEMPDLAPLVKASSWLEFSGGDPALSMQIKPREGPVGGVGFSGNLTGRDFRWRGMAVDRAKVRVAWDEGQLKMPDFSLDCYGGNLAGALVIDFHTAQLKVGKVHCSADPFAFVDAMMEREWLKGFRSPGTTEISGETLVFDLRDFSQSTGKLRVESQGGIVVPIDSMELPLMGFQGEVKFGGGKLVADAKRFSVYGGRGSGSYVMPFSKGFNYQLKFMVDGMSLKQAGQALELKNGLAGNLAMDFEGGGGSGIKSHYGSSQLRVSDGDFYAVPLLGSFRAFINKKSPNLGVDMAGDLSATLSLKNGIIHSSDLRVESEATKLLVKGDADLVGKRLDVDVRANLKGILGLATSVVSRILEVHGEGPFDKVNWRINSMRNMEGVVDGAADVVGGGAEVVRDVLKEGGEATGKLLGKGLDVLRPKKREKDGK